MFLILQSLILAPLVALRMILPLIGIFLASIVIWPIVSLLTFGFADYISEAATSAFITLFGIREALELKGDRRPTEYRMLATYSVAYGVVLSLVKTCVTFAAVIIIVIIANGGTIDFSSLPQFTESGDVIAQSTFDEIGFPLNFLMLVPFLILTPVVFAVPMAAIAQSCGRKAYSQGIFWGIGKSFVPLFIIFFVSYVLQLFFGLLTLLFVVVPAFFTYLFAILGSSEAFNFDLTATLWGLGSVSALLLGNAVLWSAAALALLKAQNAITQQAEIKEEIQMSDLRSLRKSREQNHD